MNTHSVFNQKDMSKTRKQTKVCQTSIFRERELGLE